MATQDSLKKYAEERPPGDEEMKLDEGVIALVNRETARLLDERNLRFKMKRVNVNTCSVEDVKELGELMEKAANTKVAQEYIDHGKVLSGKMEGNINARNIFGRLHDYPI